MTESTTTRKSKTPGGIEAGSRGGAAQTQPAPTIVNKLVVGGVVPNFGVAPAGSTWAAVLLAPAVIWAVGMTLVTAGLITGAIIMADKGE